jgi:putative two-component system response regulator
MTTVMIVEDDKKVAMAVSIRLASAGYKVAAVHDAATAVTEAKRCNPDLVLLDITLPAGDGFLVAERLRQNPSTCTVPIVFITASKEPGLRQRAASLKAAGFLEKPFSADALLAMIADGLDDRVAA